MKRIALIVLVLLNVGIMEAQNSKIMSAWNNLNYYHTEGQIEDLVKARDAIDEATTNEKSKINPKTWFYRGKVYYALSQVVDNAGLSDGALATAFDSFTKANEVDTKGKFAKDILNDCMLLNAGFYNQGSDEYQDGNFASAYESFMRVLKINDMANANTDNPTIDTTSILAASYSADKAGLMEEAKGLYQRLIDLKFKDAAIYQSLANIYRNEGKGDKANEVLAVGRSLFPDSKALIIDEINWLLSNDKKEEAQQKMEEAIALDPENASLHFALGTAYDSQGQLDKAVSSYQKAIDLNPEYFDANYNLGTVFYNNAAEKTKQMNELDLNDQSNYDRLKRESEDLFNKALPYFERALEINTTDRNTAIALKEIYARKGQNDKYQLMKEIIGN